MSHLIKLCSAGLPGKMRVTTILERQLNSFQQELLPDRLGLLTRMLLTRRIKMQGFIIFDDYGHRYGEFYEQMSVWLAKGRIKCSEDIVDGLLEGKNFGKLIVHISQDPSDLL